jgi:hypothetical protein
MYTICTLATAVHSMEQASISVSRRLYNFFDYHGVRAINVASSLINAVILV